MTSATLLVLYATGAGTLGAGWLRRSRWPELAPRTAVAAWQALAGSMLLALSAAGLALAFSFPHATRDLAILVDLCAQNLRHGYASPGGALAAVLGAALVLTLVTRVSWCAVRAARADRRERTNLVQVVDLVGRAGIVPGALVLDHPQPYAFCIGGRRPVVVVTSGLLATLTARELDAVLAHEQAHLRQRHHVSMVICRTLFGALAPCFPAFRHAMPLARLYAELCADDRARGSVGAQPLRDALAKLARLPVPASALAASATDVEARLLRLGLQRRHLTRSGAALATVGIGTVIVIPLALVVAPALALAWEAICLVA